MNRRPTTYPPDRATARTLPAAAAIACAVLLLAAGCSSIKIKDLPVKAAADDWMQYGGSPGRWHRATTALAPPLAPAWEYGTHAGFASFSAVAQGNYVLAADLHGDVYAMDIVSGKGRSVNDFGSPIYGAPVVDGPLIYVALADDDKENLQAFDMETGNITWKARLHGIETSPLLIDSMLYVATVPGDLVCVNKNTGTTRWTFTDPDLKTRSQSHSSPAGSDSIIVYGRDNGSLVAIDRATGALRWKHRVAHGAIATPVIAGDTVYAGATDSTVGAFDLRTGRPHWTRRMPGRVFSALAAGPEYLYVGTASGQLACLRRADGSTVWQHQAGNGFSAPPLLAGTRIYAGNLDRTVTAFDAASGAVQWQWTGEGRIKSTPIIHRNTLIVLEDTKTVIAFRAPAAAAEGGTP